MHMCKYTDGSKTDIHPKIAEKGLSIGVMDWSEAGSKTGFEVVEALGTGRAPLPPIAGQMPFVPHAWEKGAAEFRAWPEARFSNLMGTIHGGWIMTMLDTAMAIAALSTLNVGESFTSIDTSARFLRPVVETTGEVRVFGQVISRGRTVVTVDGRLEDMSGRRLATGSSTCLVMPARSGPLPDNRSQKPG